MLAASALCCSAAARLVSSELVADATVVCPNFYLAQSWQAARSGRPNAAPVYAYRATQSLAQPFCVLRDTHFRPSYCPTYASHASDMFAWLQPDESAAFNFSFSEADRRYGALINDRFCYGVKWVFRSPCRYILQKYMDEVIELVMVEATEREVCEQLRFCW